MAENALSAGKATSRVAAACQCGNLKGGQGSVRVDDAARVKPMRGKLR